MLILAMEPEFDLPEKITIFLVVESFAVEGRLSTFCGGGVIALGAMILCGRFVKMLGICKAVRVSRNE
jgi:hypothetical protein